MGGSSWDFFFLSIRLPPRSTQSRSSAASDVYKRQEMDKSGLDSEPADDDPYANEFHYKSWWNQFRGPWLQSEKMTEDEIKTRADDAWECGDYKEMINLMAELICRLEKQR